MNVCDNLTSACLNVQVTAGSEEAREKSFRKAVAKHGFTAKFPSELSFEKVSCSSEFNKCLLHYFSFSLTCIMLVSEFTSCGI